MNLRTLYLLMAVVSSLVLLLLLNACPKPQVQTVEQTLGQGGGTMALENASLSVPAGALEADVALTLTKDKPGETVDLTENETAVSGVFTLTHDQTMTMGSAGQPFALELPFDTEGLPEEDLNYLKVFVKVQIGEEVYPLVGEVSPGRIGIVVLGLPPHATFQVCHNPYVQAVTSDPVPGPKRLTEKAPWQTTAWHVLYDPNDTVVRKAVGNVLGKPESGVTAGEVLQVVKERVANNARDASVFLQDLGLRRPNLEVWTLEGWQYFIMKLFPGNDYMAWFAPEAAGNGIGQVKFSSSIIDNLPDFFLGTVKDYLAHEMFHACFDGYALTVKNNGENHRTDVGYNEGCAVVLGNTFDKGTVSARRNSPPSNFTMMLDSSVGDNIPLGKAYANDDFFAYIGRRFGNNSMRYLGGDGTDPDGDSNGMLEQIRKQTKGLNSIWSFKESFYEAYRVGMDKSFRLQFGASLADVYWEFARSRAYENYDSSQLRPGDNATMYSLNQDRFSAGMILGHVFLFVDDPPVSLEVSPPTLKEFGPFSTRAVVLSTTNFTADLEIKLNRSQWPVDTYGNSVRVIAYREDDSSVELAPGADVLRVHLDQENETVVVLVSNVNMTSPCYVSIVASVSPLRFVGGNVFACLGYGVEGTTVTARRKGQSEVLATVLSGTDGVFRIMDLPDGEIELTFEAYSYLPLTKTVTVADGQADWVLAYIMPDGEGCSSTSTAGRWVFNWDDGCNGTYDSSSYWNLVEDGTVSWVSTGLTLQGYEWRMEGDQKVVIMRPDGSSLVGTFTPDCNRLMLGEVVGGYGAPRCWEAFTNDPGK